MYLLRKLQIDVMGPRTALEQVPIRGRSFHHLRVYRIPPCVLILPVVIVCHGSGKKRLFARISFGAGIGRRGAGKFVQSERECKSCDGGIKTALLRKLVVSKPVSHIESRNMYAKSRRTPRLSL